MEENTFLEREEKFLCLADFFLYIPQYTANTGMAKNSQRQPKLLQAATVNFSGCCNAGNCNMIVL